MGMTSSPRNVLATGSGRATMYKITHKNGDSYVVNEAHIMVMKDCKGTRGIIDIPLKHLLDNPKLLRNSYKGMWTSVAYRRAQQPINPHLFGWWLADGFSHTMSISTSDKELVTYARAELHELGLKERTVNKTNTILSFGAVSKGYRNPLNDKLRELGVLNNKHIPECYMIASTDQRIALLEGIIDGDGYLHKAEGDHGDSYRIALGHNELLAQQVKELAISVGLYSSVTHSPNGYLVYVSGDLTRLKPVLSRKQSDKCSNIDWMFSSITIEKVDDDGEYYGITVDKDERYVLGNYIVTHNTSIPGDADILLGIGGDAASIQNNRRMLSPCKNKINNNHAALPVNVDPTRSKVLSI